jgi:hypothetical protein
MLEFSQDNTSAILILTLTELKQTDSTDFYFVFTHVTTKEQVTFTDQDESSYPNRYNKFTIDPSVLFEDKQIGNWHYKVYETDASGVLLEQGKMILHRATEFEFTKYNSANSFTTYNG